MLILIIEEYGKHLPERKAMTRLKENIWKIYKLNYVGLKAIMEGQQHDQIPIEPEIENPERGGLTWRKRDEKARVANSLV